MANVEGGRFSFEFLVFSFEFSVLTVGIFLRAVSESRDLRYTFYETGDEARDPSDEICWLLIVRIINIRQPFSSQWQSIVKIMGWLLHQLHCPILFRIFFFFPFLTWPSNR